MTGDGRCWPLLLMGHTTAPPTRAMNSRRLILIPAEQDAASRDYQFTASDGRIATAGHNDATYGSWLCRTPEHQEHECGHPGGMHFAAPAADGCEECCD